MSKAADTVTLLKELTGLLGATAKLWPTGKGPQLDDLYEAYLWAETLRVAKAEGWKLTLQNAGASNDQFTFRKGPGLLTSSKRYTHARLRKDKRRGELHIGIRVCGVSNILHEFDVVAFDAAALATLASGQQPDHSTVRFHIEAKFHSGDLSLGIARGIVGLGVDCPAIEPFLVSRGLGSESVRPLIKAYGGHYVHGMFPSDTGGPFFETCVKAALGKWR